MIDTGITPSERAILVLSYFAGALASDIVGFRVADIRWPVEGSESGGIQADPQHIFPLDQRALGLLELYIRRSRPRFWLFEKADGSPYEAEEVLRLLNRAAERAKFRYGEALDDPPLIRQRGQPPSDKIARREEEIERVALEKIDAALAKKAGQ